MKNIEFRVWNSKAKKWESEFAVVEGKPILLKEIRFPAQGAPDIEKGIHTIWNEFQFDDSLQIQQFTGFLDKNGNKIFEGDIVKFSWEREEHDLENDVGEVFWEDGMFLFGRHTSFATNDSNFLKITIEVIGNIYENPELLK